jgi:L-erythro-3,5-diaminohexanoate dehydrogenase
VKSGHPLGIHRTLEPLGGLPQPAWRLNNDRETRFASEIHVQVDTLNIDAASFRQMEGAAAQTGTTVAELVRATVAQRGKQHNPVTGSGGMLVGSVIWVGDDALERGFRAGERVATLASLSLTPLFLDEVLEVRSDSAQIDVRGSAIVFASAPLARIPGDIPERIALALCDVAGAAPQVARHARAGEQVVVLGAGGKSGLLCCAEARRRVGSTGTVLGVEASERLASELASLGYCDSVLRADARDALATSDEVRRITGARAADLVVSCVNVAGVEPTALMLAKARGKVYFFAMSTSFTAAALGAEGMGRDIDMYIGNGYADGHVEHTFELVRGLPALMAVLRRRYG